MSEGLEIDAGTMILDVTPKLTRYLGISEAELQNMELASIVADHDVELVTAALAGLVQQGRPYIQLTTSLQRRNGEFFPVVLTASRLEDAQDQVTGFTLAVELANSTPMPPPPPQPTPAPALPPPPVPSPATLAFAAPPQDLRPLPQPEIDLRNEPAAVVDAAAASIPDAALPPAYRRLPVAAALVNTDGIIVDATDEWLTSFASEDTDSHTLFDMAHPASATDLRQSFGQLLDGLTDGNSTDVRCNSTRGQLWCRVSINVIAGLDLFAVTAEDITTFRAERRSLVATESLFRKLSETSPVGVARLGPDMVIDYTNPQWRTLTGQAAQSTGVVLTDIIEPADRERMRAEINERLREDSGAGIRCRLRVQNADASPMWVSIRLARLRNDSGVVTGHIAVMVDVTDLMRAQESNSQLAGIVESTGNLVAIFDLPSRKVMYLNGAAKELFCPPGHELDDLKVSDLYTEASTEKYTAEVYPVLRRGEAWSGELSMVRADGTTIQVLQTFTAELDQRGNIRRLSALGHDVSDQARALDQLAYQATHDSLTGLPNRSLLIDHMELAMARSARDHTPIALLFLDLDRFKTVNDTHGHDVGDLLLQEIAHRLRTVIRPSDTVARLGGDEFVVLADDIEGERDAVRIAERVRQAIEGEPFELGDVVTTMSASIGIAISNGGSVRDAASLLREADTAMFRAKRGGRGRHELFDDKLRERNQQRAAMSEELADALQNNRLVAYFHPMIDLGTGRIVGAEALARWVHPARGVIPARDFMETAEDAGLAHEVDAASARHAVAQAAAWHREFGDTSPVVHINASQRSLTGDRLAALLAELMDANNLPAHRLCIEISEGLVNDYGDDLMDRLNKLRNLGLRVAVDSVGSSALPLSDLGRYPFTMLKIAPVVTAQVDDVAGAQLVRAIVALAGALGFHVGAEGADLANLTQVLRRTGVNSAQGTAFAAPLPGDQVTPLIGQQFRTN